MLNGLQVTQVDVFRETAMLLDYLLAKRDIGQEQVDSLWNKLLLDIRTWKNDATEHDKWMVASTVFQIVRAMLTQHTEICFCETVCEMLDKTTERNKKGCDEEEYEEFRHKLIEHSRVMSEWMIGYEEADEWLSDKIEHYIEEAMIEPDEKKKRGRKPKTTAKPEKQHGLEYPVFAKGQGVTDAHIKALYLMLTTRGWIGTQTNVVDFKRLFSGESNNCEIIWTGQDKMGSNEPTTLGVSALYVLFKRMAEEKLISIGNNSSQIGPILETHFVDAEGRFLTSVSNVSTTSNNANDYIKKILMMMKKRISSDDIQSFLEEEMVSQYDKNDMQDLRYHKRH